MRNTNEGEYADKLKCEVWESDSEGFHEGRRHESTGGGSDGFRVMMLVMI
jgi:hypothetical protein